MVGSKRRRNRQSGRLVVAVFLFFMSLITAAAEDIAVDRIVTSPEKVFVGDRVYFQYYLLQPYSPFYQLKSIPQIEGMDLISDPQIRSWTDNSPSAPSAGYTLVSFLMKAEQRGVFPVSDIVIINGSQEFPLPSFDLAVLKYDERDWDYPIDLKWVIPSAERYTVGQSIPLTLVLTNADSITFPTNVQFTPPPGGFFEESTTVLDIESNRYNNDPLYTIPVKSWIMTISEAGELTVPSATVTWNGLKRTSDSLTLEIDSLPGIVQQNGAVGRFSVFSDISSVKQTVDDVFELRIRIEGVGNFNYLTLPAPELPSNAVLVSKDENYDFRPVANGLVGEREVVYRFQIQDSGEYDVSIPGFFWLNPETQSIQNQSAIKYSLTVTPSVIQGTEDVLDFSALYSLKEIRFHHTDFSLKNPYLYLLLLPGVTILILLIILKRKKKEPVWLFGLLFLLLGSSRILVYPGDVSVESGLKAAEDDRWEAAVRHFQAALAQDTENAQIMHNLGVAYYKLNNPARSVYYLRKAVAYAPWLNPSRHALLSVEENFELDQQPELPWVLHVEIYTMIVFLCINGILLLSWFYFRKKKIRTAISAILTILVLLLGLSGIMLYYSQLRQPTAVVMETGGDLRKVPGDSATKWLNLPAGTCLSVEAEIDGYYLVRTGYGVQGWLPVPQIKLVNLSIMKDFH